MIHIPLIEDRRTIMTLQDTSPAAIERHMRHAHQIRSQAMLHALGRIPAVLRRATKTIMCVFA